MLCILQARMSSQRLPGKVLHDLHGRVLLGRVVDRIRKAQKVSKLIVATSDHQSDQSIVDFCVNEKITCVRGSLDNVADRIRKIAEQEQAKAFVRVSGDSPLLDPALVDQAIGYFEIGPCDLVTNVLTRTFPKGQSVEVILSETFSRSCESLVTKSQREHVTTFFYENPQQYRIVSFSSGMELGHVNLSVDTPEDFVKVESVLSKAGNNPKGWRELTSIYQTV